MTISRRHITLAIVLAAAVLAGLAALKWNAVRGFSDPRIVLSRFPVEDAVVVNADFAAVRGAGLLTESKLPLEPDYKQFLDGTGFDYRKDLDAVTASFSKSGNFFIARGRFNWAKLRDYAAHQGGSCYQDLCRMPGSTPERRISFLPLRDDTMALAVSTDDLAANRLTKPGNPVTAALPSAPVWMIIPGTALHDTAAVPPGLRLMLSALTNADRLVVTLEPSGGNLDAKMLDVKMEATCRSKDDAHVLASQLRSVTAKLKEALQQNKDAQGDELVKVLVGGQFDDRGALVDGTWPFSKSLIASLTAGI
jgi:hypothetical protein